MQIDVERWRDQLLSTASTIFNLREMDTAVVRTKADSRHHTDLNNQAYESDSMLQKQCELVLRALAAEWGFSITILGEEVGGYPDDLAGVDSDIVAFVDAIDGTDLMVRGFSNFCFTVALYSPRTRRILLSFVAHSAGRVYYTDGSSAYRGVYVKGKIAHWHPLVVDQQSRLELEDASICAYGQKPSNLLALFENRGFMGFIAQAREAMTLKKRKRSIRFYNLAGIPMMVKVPDGDVDVVFDLVGQEVHDVIPGAHIAQVAGAAFIGLEDGADIDCSAPLRRPRQRVTYVLARNKKLAKKMRDLVKS